MNIKTILTAGFVFCIAFLNIYAEKKVENLTSENSTPIFQWQTNFEEAKQLAQKENRFVLVYFSNSKRCIWCRKLDKEVLTTLEFQKYAAERFVLVKYDVATIYDKKIAVERESLLQQFHIRGTPAIVMFSSAGDCLYQMGYEPNGPQKYIENCEANLVRSIRIFELRKKLKELKDSKKRILEIDSVLKDFTIDQLNKSRDLLRELLSADANEFPEIQKRYSYFTRIEPLEMEFETLLFEIEKTKISLYKKASQEQRKISGFHQKNIADAIHVHKKLFENLYKKLAEELDRNSLLDNKNRLKKMLRTLDNLMENYSNLSNENKK